MPSIAIPVSLRGQLLSSVRAFDPISLFAASEPGIWLDPSDLTTLFQDTAGTQPVTTPGQTVALALDKSKGLVLGPELVTNGDFSNGSTGWTLQPGVSIVDGVAVFDGATSFSANAVMLAPTSSINVVAGRTYRVSFTITAATTRAVGVILGGTTGLSNGAAGTYTSFITPASSGSISILARFDTGARTGGVDNISVRELPGFHATQSILASRPTYGIVPATGRRNSLTWTEDFSNPAWVKQAATATAGILTENSGSGPHVAVQSFTYVTGNYTFAVDFKPNGRDWVAIQARSNASYFGLIGAGSLGNISGTIVSRSITLLPDGYYRCVITVPATAGADNVTIYLASANGTVIYTGDGVSGVLIRNAQLELGSTATAYQRVGSSFDVTEAGVPSLHYLSFDGVDDFLITPTITPGIDKAQVFAGVRKLSDTASGTIIAELSTTVSNGGAFYLITNTSAGYGFGSNGTTLRPALTNTPAAPSTNVLTGIGDISGDVARLRQNGSQSAETLADQGTGNYLAYPLYIGRRGGTSLPFNGQIYSLIVRFGANLDAGTISQTETWVAGKTGIAI